MQTFDESEVITTNFLENSDICSKLTSIRNILNKKITMITKQESKILDLLEEPKALELLVKTQIEFEIKIKKK